MNVKTVPSIKKKLFLKLRKEQNPNSIPELMENAGDDDILAVRRQSLPLPILENSYIVYEENIPVVVRRRGVTLTVRIFGAEESLGTSPGTSLTQDTETVRYGGNGRSNSICSERSVVPTRWLVSPTRRHTSTRSVESLHEPRFLRVRRHSTLSGRSRHLSSLGLPGTPDTESSSLSLISPVDGDLRSESPTHGIGLFKQV